MIQSLDHQDILVQVKVLLFHLQLEMVQLDYVQHRHQNHQAPQDWEFHQDWCPRRHQLK
jgi:hypothetical protein